ncbi:hypothetical protein [Nocardia sp. SC052]|uniref:hypothetical protein n=1 Tax=Nocardia sichangensis TaxID=3385975 RepID=UPI0039A226D0
MTPNYRLSPRDMRVVTILAEMYGAPMDRVAGMLGVQLTSAYRTVAKWRATHLVSGMKVRPVAGHTWVFPTRSATEAILPYYAKYWTPSPKMAAHVTAVLDVRLALTGQDLDRWIPERQLRAELGMARPGEQRQHVHDGRFYDSEGRLWAVEVELTAKNLAAAKISVAKALHAARKANCAGVMYFCRTVERDRDGRIVRRTDEIRNVIATAVKAVRQAEDPVVRAAILEEVLGTNAETTPAVARPGLSLIEGGASDRINQAALGGRDTGEAVS